MGEKVERKIDLDRIDEEKQFVAVVELEPEEEASFSMQGNVDPPEVYLETKVD